MKNMSKGEVLALVVVMSLLFSYSLGLVMLFFHEVILGAREITPIAFGWHWLRDSSIAFPIAIIVSLVAVPISQTIAKRVTGRQITTALRSRSSSFACPSCFRQ